jgi:hypothetical protein
MIKIKKSQTSAILIALILALVASISKFAWVSIFILPTFIILVLFSLYHNNGFSIYRPSKIPIFYFSFIWLIFTFILLFEPGNATGRSYVEFLSIILYFVIFAVMSRVYRFRNISTPLFFLFLFIILFSFIYGAGIKVMTENNQIYAYVFFISLPFLICFFDFDKKITIRVLFLFVVIQMFIFENRMPVISFLLIMFVVNYWSLLSRNAFVYFTFICLLFIFSIFGPVIYLSIDLATYDELSRQYFNKGIDGRSFIWIDLIANIKDNLWFGKCSNCASMYSLNELESRSLSSHNTFLELLFRMGVVGLLPFLFMLISLLYRFYIFKHIAVARFGAAYIVGSVAFMSANEFSLTQTFTANLIFWAGVGILYGKSNLHSRVI